MSRSDPPVDFRALFDGAPELFLAVRAEEDYRIAAASDPYLRATMTRREDIVGRPLFEVFPANPDDPANNGQQQLRAALDHVRAGGPAETLPEWKYDIRRPGAEGGGFEERYWETSAAPVRGRGRHAGTDPLPHGRRDGTEALRPGTGGCPCTDGGDARLR